ncbi:MAG: right-handed parallel beta-helix repeat-containing protein [Leptospiraceae bacterium]|nr:right-handed parallel beta-helix repeat-containing protein [Leptospiraceae bacterium]MCP5512386.1 right-handed parallel beta-helix repeat-containing protein [Leptospiraceae bacterium]
MLFFQKLAFLLILILFSCGGDGSGEEEGVYQVKMFDNVFVPPLANPPIGGKVRFINIGNNPHNAIATDKSWSTEPIYGDLAIPHGKFVDISFPEEGSFPYYCSFHASPDGKLGMVGKVVVGNQTLSSPEEDFKRKPVSTWTGKTRLVPREYPNIQNAVDSASPGDLILIADGIYKEEVIVTTPSLILRGNSRSGVIIDGEFLRGNGIMVVGADGVTVENMTFRNHTLNGVYWTGVNGYRGSYLTAYNNGDYGIYAFDSVDGVLEHSYASGSPDSGIYIGQCYPCDAIIYNVIAENNALGYSGTNSGGNLFILSSVWRNNFIGIAPNSLDRELLPPERETTVLYNLVYENNNMNAPSHKLEFPSIGNGISLLGGIRNRVEKNVVLGHKNYGISSAPNLDEKLWLGNSNVIRDNIVLDSGRGDIALMGPVSFGNCFENNKYNHSSPVLLEVFQSCNGLRYPWVGDLSSTLGMFSLFIQVNNGDFARVSYKNQPIPPDQPEMSTEEKTVIEPALGVFEKRKFLIEKAEFPKETNEKIQFYKSKIYDVSGPLKIHFPTTFMTFLFYWILYLLPFGLYSAWTGTAILDIVKRFNEETWVLFWFPAILFLPYLGSLMYHYMAPSKLRTPVKNTMILGGIFTILLLLVYSVYGLINVSN